MKANFKSVALIFVLVLLCALSNHAKAEKLRVLLMLRDSPEVQFWNNMSKFAQAAANDLNIELTVHFANYDDQIMLEKFREMAHSDKKPDYLITLYAGTASTIIKEADELGIYTYLINAGIPKEERNIMGFPRGKYAYWLGEMIPDDILSGYLVGKHLLENAQENGFALSILPVNGNTAHEVPIARYQGLTKAANEFDNATVLTQINTYWDANLAKSKTIERLNENRNTTIVWTAADFLAEAAYSGAKSINRNIITGGVDWASDTIEKVANEEIQLSVGGHFMDAAWALVLVHDHSKGLDFRESFGTSTKSDFFVLVPSTARAYRSIFKHNDFDKIYFRRFSKYYNTGLNKYRFDLMNVMVQFLW